MKKPKRKRTLTQLRSQREKLANDPLKWIVEYAEGLDKGANRNELFAIADERRRGAKRLIEVIDAEIELLEGGGS
jgi:hypothetical protein